MNLFFKLAWRNIFRNKRRTYITGVAIGIGLASLIWTDALVIGMEENMIRSGTASYLGEGQIHAEGFRETFEIDQTINNLDQTVAGLRGEPMLDKFTLRAITFAMISSPANVSAVSLVGVEPETEQHLSQIDDALVEGAYFEGDSDRDIIIGRKLAEILEVELGDRVVLTAAQAHTGDLAQEMFRISGIYFFNAGDMDRGMAFIRLPMAQQMLNLGDDVHEISLKFTDNTFARDTRHPFWDRYSTGGNKAEGWPDILPQLEAAFELSEFSTLIVGFILFVVVTLSIINTLFMSLYERMYEFGVMRAVGTSGAAIARLVVFEAAALAIVSNILGVVLGFVATYIFTLTGIDYGGIEFVGVTFRELLYPVIELQQFIFYPVAVFIFTVIVSLYPAVHAARIIPAEAMRKSL